MSCPTGINCTSDQSAIIVSIGHCCCRFDCLLLNCTSALFRLLVPRIVEIKQMRHVKIMRDKVIIRKSKKITALWFKEFGLIELVSSLSYNHQIMTAAIRGEQFIAQPYL